MSKTVTTYLIDGDPKGTQYVFVSNNNSWLVWKDKDGETLDSVYRKQLE